MTKWSIPKNWVTSARPKPPNDLPLEDIKKARELLREQPPKFVDVSDAEAAALLRNPVVLPSWTRDGLTPYERMMGRRRKPSGRQHHDYRIR